MDKMEFKKKKKRRWTKNEENVEGKWREKSRVRRMEDEKEEEKMKGGKKKEKMGGRDVCICKETYEGRVKRIGL